MASQLPHKHFDCNDPADARKFLKGLRAAGGQKVERFKLANGRWLEIAKLTDDEAMDYASQLYQEVYVPGGMYYVEEDILQ
jgi:hypothetical protein